MSSLTKKSLLVFFFYNTSLWAFPWISRTLECTRKPGEGRKVELTYANKLIRTPCKSAVYLESEKYEKAHVLFEAITSSGVCEKEERAYLNRLKKEKFQCSVMEAQKTLENVPKEKVEKKVETKLEEKNTISAPTESNSIELKAGLSHAVINLDANGKAEFKSKNYSPEIKLNLSYTLGTNLDILALSEFQYMKFYNKNSSGTFNAPSSFIWAAGVGPRFNLTPDLSLLLDGKVKRRVFILRSNSNYQGFKAAIAQSDIKLRYRIPITEKQSLYAGLGMSYLFSASTLNGKVNSGSAFQYDIAWENSNYNKPISIGIDYERIKQNTQTTHQTQWEIGIWAGIKFKDLL